MRYGVGGGIYSGMRRRASGSGGLGEHVAGLRRAEGLEGQAALGHAKARELPRDGRHELLGPACVEIKFQTPSTRRRPRSCVCLIVWRFHAIDASQSSPLVAFHTAPSRRST